MKDNHNQQHCPINSMIAFSEAHFLRGSQVERPEPHKLATEGSIPSPASSFQKLARQRASNIRFLESLLAKLEQHEGANQVDRTNLVIAQAHLERARGALAELSME